jgi:hypothetical protein
MRYMFLVRGSSEGPPTPALMAAMHTMAEAEIAAGRMVYDGGLMPAAQGRRMRVKGGKVLTLDGPFAETKEVIGGFAIFELPDMAAALESGRRFLDLHVEHAPGWEGELEVREVAGSQVEAIRGGA